MNMIPISEAPIEAAISTPRKRNHEGELVIPHVNQAQDTVESKSTNTTSRQPSPSLSDTSSELTELTSTGVASPAPKKMKLNDVSENSVSTPTSTKKRKLTFAEKEVEKAVRQREKEEKIKQKAEEKARREEEKRQRDEEKRKKEEEKEIERRAKDLEKAEKKRLKNAEKQGKEAEKAKKDADKKDKELEKLRKERSQLRIGAFFGRPAPQSTPPTTPDDIPSGASSRRSSIVAIDISEPIVKVNSQAPSNPGFDAYIIPYFVHDNTEIAPANRFRAARRANTFDGKQSEYQLETEKTDIEPLHTRFGPSKKRQRLIEPVKEIAERVHATQINSVDLTGDYNPLAYVQYKILSFREDIRPPYIGTYTRRTEPAIARKLSRRPTHRARPDTNYDYDSEAEWEEPAADDEEILDDVMSESEDGEEEMQDFLDDEDDQGRRRMFASEMEPISSGLCFQGEAYNSNGHNMEDYRMGVLHDSTTFPIDPFSTTHWSDISKTTLAKPKADACVSLEGDVKLEAGTKNMPPPRVPLATVNPPNTLNGFLSAGGGMMTSQKENAQSVSKPRGRPGANKDVKMVSAEYIDDFKKAISGSDLTKAGLVEILKKQFPKCSKDAIKDTLGVVAIRVGKKESEKKWELV